VIGTASEYWSANPSDVWLFNGRDNALNKAYRDRVTLGAPLALDGRTLMRFDYSRPFNDPASAGPQYRSLDSDGIHAYLEEIPSTLSRAFLELPAQIRQETYLAYEQTDPIPGGTETLRIDVIVIGFETLVLPAGTFPNALKVQQRFTVTVTLDGQTASASINLNLWYAKGIGVIKQTLDDPSAVLSLTTQVEELAGVSVAAAKAGVVGEFTLLDNLTVGISSLTTGRPGVASDGSGYLIAARKVNPTTSETQIVATYVNASGQSVWSKVVIDGLGVASPGSSYEDPVPVAFDGTNFWIVARSSVLNSTNLLRQRVSPAGVLADPVNGILIADGWWPILASNGNSVLLVVGRTLGSPTFEWAMYATLYGGDGTVLRAEQQIAAPGSGNLGYAAAAANGGQYLVTYELGDPRDVYALRIDNTGLLLDTTPIAVSTAIGTQGSTAVAPWGNTDFVSLWIDSRNYVSGSGQFDIFGARVSGAGVLLDGPADSGGVALNQRASERFGTAAATGAKGTLLAWTIGSFANLTSQPTGVFAQSFAPNSLFAVPDPTADGTLIGLVTNQDYGVRLMAPAAAASGDGHIVIWIYNNETYESQKSVRGALVYPLFGSP
jgi:hypothetical protein